MAAREGPGQLKHDRSTPESRRNAAVQRSAGWVESRMGAVAWGLWPTPRFLSPLIELDVPISGIQLSDWLHRKAHGEEDRPQASSAAGFPLRLSTQQSRMGPVIDAVLRLIATPLPLPIFESTPDVS